VLETLQNKLVGGGVKVRRYENPARQSDECKLTRRAKDKAREILRCAQNDGANHRKPKRVQCDGIEAGRNRQKAKNVSLSL
jgi:hypothetical protein